MYYVRNMFGGDFNLVLGFNFNQIKTQHHMYAYGVASYISYSFVLFS